jgi:nucleoside-diphosphate-sugar epimerase
VASALSTSPVVLILGASTAAGRFFLERASGTAALQLIAVSRTVPAKLDSGVTWLQHDLAESAAPANPSVLVSFGPVGLAAKQLAASASIGRVMALSSASTLFKSESEDAAERALMHSIIADERRLIELCKARNAALDLFKTTMIYGGGSDANISRLRALIKRLPVVPVVGAGLRAPVHADDLARLALSVLSDKPSADQRTWLLEGGERLTYTDLVGRVAAESGVPARIVRPPLWTLRFGLALAHRLGRLRDIKTAMLARQADDLVVDDSPAREQLGWNPRRFSP